MERVSIDEIDPEPHDAALHADRRELTEPLGVDGIAIARYALEPGERFSGSVHAHADQEELFVVLAGTATFETRTGTVTVADDEAIRFAPGEFQSGRNDGHEDLIAIAIGAPRETDDIRIDRIPVLDDRDVSCPDCDRDSMRISGGESAFACQDCGAGLDLE